MTQKNTRPRATARTAGLGLLGATALATLAALPAAAQDQAVIRTTMISIMAANNCLMDEKQLVAQLKAKGIGVQQVLPVVKAMIGEKVARRGKGKFQLAKSVCPPKPDAQRGVTVEATTTTSGTAQTNYAAYDAKLIEAALDNGCRLTKADARTSAAAAGLTLEQAEATMTAWVLDGRASYAQRTVILSDALCPAIDVATTKSLGWTAAAQPTPTPTPTPTPEPTYTEQTQQPKNDGQSTFQTTDPAPDYLPPEPFLFASQDPLNRSEPMTKFLLLIRQNGCIMHEDEADAILPTYGLTREQVLPIIDQFEAEGVMSFDDQGNAILGTLLCGAHGIDPFDFGTRADILLEYVEDSGCYLEDGELLEVKMRDVGYFLEDMPDIVDILLGDGTIYLETSPDTGAQALVANTEYCGR